MAMNLIASIGKQINIKFRQGDAKAQFTTVPVAHMSDVQVKEFVEALETYTKTDLIRSVTETKYKNTNPVPDSSVGNNRPKVFKFYVVSADETKEKYVSIAIPEIKGDMEALKTLLLNSIRCFAADDTVILQN